MIDFLWRLFFGKRIVLLVGHTRLDQGAMGHTRMSEYRYWSAVAEKVAEDSRHDVVVEYKDVGAIRTDGNDYLFELHFNAFDKAVSGCECIYNGDASEELANQYCEYISNALGNTNRGPKHVWDNQRGLSNVAQGEACAKKMLLCEPFFGDNPHDYVSINLMAQTMTGFLNQL